MKPRLLALFVLVTLLSGCSWFRPHGIKLTMTNQSSTPIQNVEFDFPGGSFGINSLAPGASAERWFNPTSSTNLKVIFKDPTGIHTTMLQTVSAQQSGEMTLTFIGNAKVTTDLKPLLSR
jgi:hypothetical protein